MSIQQIIKEALEKSPLGVKAALQEELRVRVSEAISSKMSATDLEEEIKDGDKVSWHDPSVGKNVTGVVTMASGMKRKGIKHAQVRIDNSHGTTTKVPHSQLKKIDEEVDQIDEISKATLGSYIKKAIDNKAVQDRYAGRTGDRESYSISDRRDQGIKRAVNKLTKEEVEQIDEAKAIHEYDWPESALHRGASLGDHAQDAIRHNMHAHDAIGHVYSAADAEGRKWVNKHHDDLLKTFKSHGLQTEEAELKEISVELAKRLKDKSKARGDSFRNKAGIVSGTADYSMQQARKNWNRADKTANYIKKKQEKEGSN